MEQDPATPHQRAPEQKTCPQMGKTETTGCRCVHGGEHTDGRILRDTC